MREDGPSLARSFVRLGVENTFAEPDERMGHLSDPRASKNHRTG